MERSFPSTWDLRFGVTDGFIYGVAADKLRARKHGLRAKTEQFCSRAIKAFFACSLKARSGFDRADPEILPSKGAKSRSLGNAQGIEPDCDALERGLRRYLLS
jgi:hypothetical protein